jgi:putative PIN family toxin of toxin-antitoxin system
VRAVLDPNILIASLLSREGAPARLVSSWLAGAFEMIVSESLLEELERALTYPKLRDRVATGDASEFVALLRHTALLASEPSTVASRSEDPDDDYLLALAEQEQAILVSSDRHLLALADRFPVVTARALLETLTEP